MTSINPIDKNQKVAALTADASTQDKLQSEAHKKVAEALLKESTSYSNDAGAKEEKARELITIANQLEQKAAEIRRLAEKYKTRQAKAEEVNAVNLIADSHQITDIPIPKDASPDLIVEYLGKIADRLEAKAKEHREKADEMLKEAEQFSRLSSQLKDQAQFVSKKEENLSDTRLQSIVSKNEKLRLVMQKLGIMSLDSEYKEQVAYSERKAQEFAQKG